MTESGRVSEIPNLDQIFYDLSDPVEDVNEYRPGGYYPIQLGQSLRNGRYLILRKLGYGSYSTVWLARDQTLSEFVALKIKMSRCSDQNEIKIHTQLAPGPAHHPGSSNVLPLKDHFNIQGPNGTHSCLVYEAMGPSVISMSMDRVSGEAIVDGQNKRFTLSAARTILHQVLLGLDFIHSRGLVHGDFHSGNWLFSLREMSNMSVEDVRQSEDRVSAPVRRLDGSSDSSAPPFLTLDQPLREWVATGNDLQIKISDLGSAFFADSPPTNPQTPVNLRSPELLLHRRSSTAQDVWAFGCLVYSLLTNLSLFELFDMGNRNYLDDDHILQIIELLGPLPADLKSAWLRYRNYFDENDIQTVFVVDWAPSLGNLDENLTEEEEGQHRAGSDVDPSDSNAEEDEEGEEGRGGGGAHKARWRGPEPANAVPTQQLYPSLVEVVYDGRTSHAPDSNLGEGFDAHARPVEPLLTDRWLRDKHPAMAPEEAEAVASLLRQILQYDPAKRPTTTNLLKHPWIEKFCAGKGR